MKLGRLLTLSLAPLACVGQIPDEVTPPPVDVGACSAETLAKPRVWRLTSPQIRNTLRDALGAELATIEKLPALNRLDGYANRADNLPIDPLLADQFLKISEELAETVSNRSKEFVACPAGVDGLGEGSCLRDFVTSFGLKLWRRPPTDAEIASFGALYSKTAQEGGNAEAGLRSVVQAFFLSPHFLFRTELGQTQQAGAVTYLTDYELASALSYSLWDTAPDAILLDLARAEEAHRQEGAGRAGHAAARDGG